MTNLLMKLQVCIENTKLYAIFITLLTFVIGKLYIFYNAIKSINKFLYLYSLEIISNWIFYLIQKYNPVYIALNSISKVFHKVPHK